MSRAFEPFLPTKGKGLGGVGLPMVKHFAEAHRGSVEIESALGSGTTVILRLPAAPLSAVDDRQNDQSRPLIADESPRKVSMPST